MIIRRLVGGVETNVTLTEASVTAGRGDEFVVAWDRGGRLYTLYDAGETWRRGLNGHVLVKRRDARGRRQRRWADEGERDRLIDRAAAFAGDLLGEVGRRAEGDLEEVLRRAATFNARAAADDARRFAEVYRPIGILPPDQYLALVLQATEGCSFGSCTFCDFYREPYRVRGASEFHDHVARVREYMGGSLLLRNRSIFLGSANALAVPLSGLRPTFDVLASEFPGRPVHAFVDGFTGTMKQGADYRELGERGLARVYIGLESGHDPLLALVRKPATADQAVAAVRAMKGGGVAVGVIVMLGLGGERFATEHVGDTAAALNAMHLGSGDFLYFSEIVTSPGSPYAESANDLGTR